MCLDNERNWRNKDYFQMASMAQTRAGSKALSNVLRFVVALDKTISGTPAEEMTSMNSPRRNTPKRAKQSKDETIETSATVKEELTLDEAASNCKPLRALIKNLKFNGEEVTVASIKSRLASDLAEDKISLETHDEIMKVLDKVVE